MRKTILFAAAAFAALLDCNLHSQTIIKHLSDYEILGTLPEGILNPVPMVDSFCRNGELAYHTSEGSFLYDYAKDLSIAVAGNARVPWSKTAEADEMVKGWKNPTYSPDRSKIAYTLDNDLYSIDVATKEITRHTFDGSQLILNGYASWVYYEEIFGRPSRYRAFWWSPDSKVLAFYRFDNTDVPMFPIYLPDGKHGYLNETRYPKAGDNNPKVKLGFVSRNGGETVWAEFDQEKDQYFGTPFWSGDGKRLMVSWMDRAQDNFMLYSVDPIDGQKEEVYGEHQDTYIDWLNEMLFSEKGVYVVRDFTGWQQVYFLSYDGAKFEQLSEGNNWAVTLLRLDKKYIYYSAKCEATTRTDIYRIRLRDKKKERISYGDLNFANPVFSSDGRYLAAYASNCKTPTQLVVFDLSSSIIDFGRKKESHKVAYDCRGRNFGSYSLALPEIIQLRTRDSLVLPARVIWPLNMDKSRKYPVKVDIYGGPDHPQVRDSWAGISFRTQWWAHHGVIQVVLDNRDGGHLGKEGLNQAYRHLGTVEFEDFIDGIKHFRALPYVDGNKIGVEGFSFGGTMTALCVTEGSEWFKYGIAGGGVYDWALYDSHYTERYMDRPQDNPEGYAAGRVIDRLDNYKGDDSNMLRITHGTGDDNVHFQNTLQLVSKLEEMHRDFELMIYPGGMHGYRGDQARHSDYQDYKFWYKYLLDSEMPSSLKEYFLK